MFLLIASALAQEPIQRSLPATMPALHVVNPAGRVLVTVDRSVKESRVMATPVHWPEGCRVEFSGDQELARLEVVRDDGNVRRCRTDVHVVLVGDTSVAIDQGRGRVDAGGMSGSLSVELGRGRVFVDEAVGAVDIQVGLGGVKMAWTESYGGSAVARVKAGRVRAEVPYGTWLSHDVGGGIAMNPIPEGLESEDRLVARAPIVRIDTAQSAISPSTMVVWNE